MENSLSLNNEHWRLDGDSEMKSAVNDESKVREGVVADRREWISNTPTETNPKSDTHTNSSPVHSAKHEETQMYAGLFPRGRNSTTATTTPMSTGSFVHSQRLRTQTSNDTLRGTLHPHVHTQMVRGATKDTMGEDETVLDIDDDDYDEDLDDLSYNCCQLTTYALILPFLSCIECLRIAFSRVSANKKDISRHSSLIEHTHRSPVDPRRKVLAKRTRKCRNVTLKFLHSFFIGIKPFILLILMVLALITAQLISDAQSVGLDWLDHTTHALVVSVCMLLLMLCARYVLISLIKRCLIKYPFVRWILVSIASNSVYFLWALGNLIYWFNVIAPKTPLRARAWQKYMYTAFIVMTLRDLILDAIMMYAMLGFAMVFKDLASAVKRRYVWFRFLNDAFFVYTGPASDPTEIMINVTSPAVERKTDDNLPVLHTPAPNIYTQQAQTLHHPHTPNNENSLHIRTTPSRLEVDRGERGGPNDRMSVVSATKSPFPVNKKLIKVDLNEEELTKKHNWLTLDFIRQNPVLGVIDGRLEEIETKPDAKAYAKGLFKQLVKIGLSKKNKDLYLLVEKQTRRRMFRMNRHANNTREKLPHTEEKASKTVEALDVPTTHSKGPWKSSSEGLLKQSNDGISKNGRFFNFSRRKEISNIAIPSYTDRKKLKDRQFLKQPLLEMFLPPGSGDAFMESLNYSGHRSNISKNEFERAVMDLYNDRKSLINSLSAREGVAKIFKQAVSIVLWAVALVILLLFTGVDLNTLLISGAAVLGSVTVILGVFYTNFFKSSLFILLHDAYNLGDRVRINSGPVFIVQKIHTFTTRFVSLYGKELVYPNFLLADATIENDSRSKQASFDMDFMIPSRTTKSELDLLAAKISKRVDTSTDFVKGSFFWMIISTQPGHFHRVSMWVTHVESWHNWRRVYDAKTEIIEEIANTLESMGIRYTLPVQPYIRADTNSSEHPIN